MIKAGFEYMKGVLSGMNNFTFQSATRIVWKDTECLAGTEVKRHADRILLHYGGGSIKKRVCMTGHCFSNESGIEFIELRFSQIQGFHWYAGLSLQEHDIPFILL